MVISDKSVPAEGRADAMTLRQEPLRPSQRIARRLTLVAAAEDQGGVYGVY